MDTALLERNELEKWGIYHYHVSLIFGTGSVCETLLNIV